MGKYLIFAGIGFELVGLILAAYYVGSYFDEKYHKQGLIFSIMAFAVLIGWLVQVLLLLHKFQKEEEKADAEKKS